MFGDSNAASVPGSVKAALLPLSAFAAALSLAGLLMVNTPAQAQAQSQPPAKTPENPSVRPADPADDKAVAPATVYRSSLSRYQAFTEPDVAPWRETNDLVRQRGGWRAYAREGREPAAPALAASAASAASAPAASAKPALPAGHAGHETK